MTNCESRRRFMRMGAAMAALPVIETMASREAAAQANTEVEMFRPGYYTPRIPETVLNKQRLPDSIIEGFRSMHGNKNAVACLSDVLHDLFMDGCIWPGVKPLV